MPLSRLENFLKNIQGNVIYVNPEELDATDDISNTGNSRTRPFKTIQRALIESARFSYQLGKDNDKFDKTTIVVSPGVHYIDNRPGYQIDTSGTVTNVNGASATIDEFGVGTNFNIQDANNVLHQFNSANGGVIMPRGTSICGSDLRKTKIRPKFVPDPKNDSIPGTAIFRVTGGCYFREFTLFDGDPADKIYKDYTTNVYSPTFSHHKLTCFEYADGVNQISGKGLTDLDMYYAKLTLAYGNASGRAIPSYPTNDDFEQVVDESRIVGAISNVGAIQIQDIYSGVNSSDPTATTIVTVRTSEVHGLTVDTPINIKGVAGVSNVNGTEYDGVHVVSQVLSDTLFTYSVTSAPASTATPNLSGLSPTVTVESDTVTSASPYIFNCSLRSVFGINGLHADGSKATGFKSMVLAQFTGVSLNKDDDAFVKYNSSTGVYEDQDTLGTSTILHTDGMARHRPDWQNFHIKASNNAQLQLVSVFAVGCGHHFICESGSDASITNSNSNFGASALLCDGFKDDAFQKDDQGFITAIHPNQKNFGKKTTFNWLKLDVDDTAAAADTKLYLRDFKQRDDVPIVTASKYFVGNKPGDLLQLNINGQITSAEIMMTVPNGTTAVSGKKEFLVGRASGISSISSDTITLQCENETHNLFTGESIRFYSADGALPDGIDYNRKYYVIANPVAGEDDKIKIATSKDNALANVAISGINNVGGQLRIVSNVVDKEPGDPGHPIQYDDTGWFINVKTGNTLHDQITVNQSSISPETPATFITRKIDDRQDIEAIYRFRYILPDSSSIAAPPQNGYTIQDSGTVVDDTNFQNENNTLSSDLDLRTETYIVDASWTGNIGFITCRLPHRLRHGQLIQINRLRSENNVNGDANEGYNGLHYVNQIIDKKSFRIGINTDPGGISTIATDIPYTVMDNSVVGSGRTFSPYFVRKEYGNAYQIFNHETIQEHNPGVQDGVYDLTLLGYHSTPDLAPFNIGRNRFPQNINYLKPFVDVDSPVDDPLDSKSYAVRDDIGKVESSDPQHSITKESTFKLLDDMGIGKKVTDVTVSGTTVTVNTEIDHNLNGILQFSSLSGGDGFGLNSGSGEFYFGAHLTGGSGEGATADVVVNSAGNISDVTLVDRGSGYQVSDTLTLRGIPKYQSGSDATIQVSEIMNNVGDIVQVVGVGSTAVDGLHRISQITDARNLLFTDTGVSVGSTGGFVYHVGVTTTITNIVHNATTGIATVTMHTDIGLRRGDQIVINGANAEYNGTWSIQDRIGYGSSLSVLIESDTAPTFSGTGAYAHGNGLGVRANGQTIPIYDGAFSEISAGLTTTSTSITLKNPHFFNRGDFLQIEDEIVRIINPQKNQIARGVMGTNAAAHLQYVAAQRIKVIPIEQRRHSTIRASGHTFEYVGYGPGNYSTGMPQTQTRVLDDDQQLLAQSVSTRGGTVVYSGMNDRGEFFIGRKKIDALTGEEISTITKFDSTPVLKVPITADFDDLTVKNNLYSLGNTELIDLQLKGNRSGAVGASVIVGVNGSSSNATPTSSIDQILLNLSYDKGGFIGYVRTGDSSPWKRWGPIAVDDTDHYAFDKLGLGQNTGTTGHRVLDATGDAYISGGISVGAASTIASLAVSDLTETRVVFAGTDGELTDNGVLYFSGSTLYSHTQVASNTITAGEFIGPGTIPVGGIIMWSGSTVPTGWSLCDGSNSTPDLRNRFIVGSGDSYNTGATGGNDSTTLSVNNMPSHFHSQPAHDHGAGTLEAQGTSNATTATHSHTISAAIDISESAHSHIFPGDDHLRFADGENGWSDTAVGNFDMDADSSSSGGDGTMYNTTSTTTGITASLSGGTDNGGASHTHPIDISVVGSTGDGGNQNTGNTGSGDSFDNRPQYYALAYIMRTT